MADLFMDTRIWDKLAAHACVNGRSVGDEIAHRIEQSFSKARPDPIEGR